jgi:hypothetical protein
MDSNPNLLETPRFKTMILECRDCGCDWLLTDQEQLSFYRKKLAMPKRCPECRQANRKALVDQATDRSSGKAGGNG